ncbi:hypothetical protein TNCV_5074931 [Trichonephila clavipes]|nr:hypothetical protein TNCV_5074931 [Trichonephila clavipes]
MWWPAEQKICRQTKITSKASGMGNNRLSMNGTPLGKQEKWQLPVPVLLITGYHKRNFSCKLQNQSFSLDWSAVVDEPRIGRFSVELKPLQQLRPLGRE